MHHSFGFHKSPKSQKRMEKNVRSLKERKRTERSEQKRTWCPTLNEAYLKKEFCPCFYFAADNVDMRGLFGLHFVIACITTVMEQFGNVYFCMRIMSGKKRVVFSTFLGSLFIWCKGKPVRWESNAGILFTWLTVWKPADTAAVSISLCSVNLARISLHRQFVWLQIAKINKK